jgi:hypothetical protein
MDIEVEQITIIIDTNRPNKSKNDLLTKHIFYGFNSSYKDKFYEEFPFFTKSVRIPKDYLRRKTFDEKIMFFFNRKTFIDTLSNKNVMNQYEFNEGEMAGGDGKYKKNGGDSSEKVVHDSGIDTSICNIKPSKNEEDDNKVIEYNLATMIELLFTTVYPSVNDNSDSFNKLIMKSGQYTLSLDGTIPKLFKSIIPSLNVEFSYIILDGKEYTVTSTCILNDIINHPEYNKLIHKLVEFKKWKIQTMNEVEMKITRIIKKIRFNITNNFDDNDKVLYEVTKNIREYNHYEPNPGIRDKVNGINKLFDKFVDITDVIDYDDINIIDKIENNLNKNRPYPLDICGNIVVGSDNEIYNTEFLREINGKKNNKNYLFKTDKKLINDYTDDIIKNIRRILDHKYSFQVIRSLIDEYLMMMVIKRKYFDKKDTKNPNVDYDVISSEIEKYFKNNYTKYAELITYISKFVSPNCVSSNRNLQCMINTFFENKNDVLENSMKQVFEKYIDDANNTQRISEIASSSLFTGVNSYNTENNFGKLKYEAYVSFNLISGKLTHDDLSNISCEYKDEELGNNFVRGRSESSIHVSTLIDREKMIKNSGEDAKVIGGKRKRRNTIRKKTTRCKRYSNKKKTMKCRSK